MSNEMSVPSLMEKQKEDDGGQRKDQCGKWVRNALGYSKLWGDI